MSVNSSNNNFLKSESNNECGPEGKLIKINSQDTSTNSAIEPPSKVLKLPEKTIKLRLSVIRAPHPLISTNDQACGPINSNTNISNSTPSTNSTNNSNLFNKPNIDQNSILTSNNKEIKKNFLRTKKNIFTTSTPFKTFNTNNPLKNNVNLKDSSNNFGLVISTNENKNSNEKKNLNNHELIENKNKSSIKKFSCINTNNNTINNNTKNINININQSCPVLQIIENCDNKTDKKVVNDKTINNIFNSTSTKLLFSTNNNQIIGSNIINNSNNPNCNKNLNNININFNNSFSPVSNSIININNYCTAATGTTNISNNNITKNLEILDNINSNPANSEPQHQNVITLNSLANTLFKSSSIIDFKETEKKKIKKRLKELRIKHKRLGKEGSYNCGRWQPEEHERFIEAIMKFGNEWKQVQKYVGTRSSTQARSHAQKFFVKIKRSNVLDLNIDLSKNSIKNLHDMANSLNSDEYINAIKALNCVAFERKGNSSTNGQNSNSVIQSKRKHKKNDHPNLETQINISEDCDGKLNLM